MNSTKKNSEFGGVKKKLTAAIAMLLVATIMMVSSTYAWFTLSTAPEVTGITTSVGANGNLEMALLTKDTYKNPAAITSAVGDSSAAQEVTKANITWGNLVDLSDASYGLNSIKLNPSRLNVSGTGGNYTLTAEAPIKVAEYGSDGRVSSLSASTVSGIYKQGSGTDAQTSFIAGDDMGVRALGTASGMSDQQIAYRNALAYIATYTIQARDNAQQSLTLYGSDLAQIAIKHETTKQGETETYTKADIETINALLAKLRAAKGNVETALKYAVLAQVSSAVGNPEKLSDTKTAVEDTSKTLSDVITASGWTAQTNSNFDKAKNLYDSISIPADITTEKESYTWADISTVVNGLMKTDGITLNTHTISTVKDHISDLINDLSAGRGFTLTMGNDSGIYDTLAKLSGNISAQVDLGVIHYDGISVGPLTATMKTNAATPSGLANVATDANDYGKPEKADDTEEIITDTYAFAIDMAFRTNASGAKLQLQTEAVNRIYDGSTNVDTMGGGSTYTFTVANGFTEQMAKDLAECIHIVFVDKSGKVVNVAGLDTENMKGSAADGYTANVVMQTATFGDNGIAVTTKNANSATICNLQQNEILVLSAYVYLDGDAITNSMVGYNVISSMTGKLNLQFSTDADLKPMDYTPLKQG